MPADARLRREIDALEARKASAIGECRTLVPAHTLLSTRWLAGLQQGALPRALSRPGVARSRGTITPSFTTGISYRETERVTR